MRMPSLWISNGLDTAREPFQCLGWVVDTQYWTSMCVPQNFLDIESRFLSQDHQLRSARSFQAWNDRHLGRVVWPMYDLYCCLDPISYWHEISWSSHLLKSLTPMKSLCVTHLILHLAFYLMPWQKPWRHKLFKHQFETTERGVQSNQLEIDFPRFQILWEKGSFSDCFNVT